MSESQHGAVPQRKFNHDRRRRSIGEHREGHRGQRLYSIQTEHAADMLLTRELSSNTIFVVDIYSPGSAGQLNPNDLASALRAAAIPTDGLKIVGGHGTEVDDYAKLQAALQ